MITYKEETAPSTPPTGYVRMYAKTDGKVYMKDDAGVETELAGTAAILKTLADAKGDIFVATADNVVDRLAVGTDGTVLTADSTQTSGVKWASSTIGKNAIINGDFNVWQRGTSFTSPTAGTYTTDRWFYSKVGAMVHDVSRSTDVPTVAQAGRLFNYSLLVDCTTVDSSIAATDHCIIAQHIEGYNFLPLAQRAIVLSFWVKGTKTGTHCVSARNGGSDRSYVGEYTISVSDTWEKKTVTMSASPSAGTWDYTTGKGLTLCFVLAVGSTLQTSAGSWQTGDFFGTANQVNACDNTANNFRITGVQLESGTSATDFEQRSFQQELILCQRYFEKSYSVTVAPGTITTVSYVGGRSSGANLVVVITFKVPKRTTPTTTYYSPGTGATGKWENFDTLTDVATVENSSGENYAIAVSSVPDGNFAAGHFAANAEL